MSGKLICNKCGADFAAEPLKRQEGDFDIVYIQCPHCKEEYLVSVTDSVLRDAISRYLSIMEKARTTADAETSMHLAETARQMKESNLKRCFELMAKYHENKEKKQ